MHVNQDGFGAGHFLFVFAEHQRLAVVRQLLRGKAAFAKGRFQPFDVLDDVGGIGGVVR